MRLPARVQRLALSLIAAIVIVGAILVVLHVRSRNNSTSLGSTKSASIPAAGGITLSAQVITPAGSGPFPLLVMPASWGAAADEYRKLALPFVRSGYQIVAYAERGFGASGGRIDFGGPATQHDVSTVIDWALAHTRADPAHIGVFGVSLGGGVALLAAEHDPRIKAVVATSAWTDLADALAPRGTVNHAGLAGLFQNPRVAAALDSQVRSLARDLDSNPKEAAALLDRMSRTRSADRDMRALDRNHTAVMIANAFEDSLFDPSSLVPFFAGLHTAKRLQLAPGEHTGPEWPAVLGKRDRTVQDAARWLDHYVRGVDNGIDRADPVVLENGLDGSRNTYRAWPAEGGAPSELGAPGVAGDLGTDDAEAWSRTVTTGADSGADVAGAADLSAGTFDPATVAAGSLHTARAFIWAGRPVGHDTAMNGLPTLQLRVRTAAPHVTLDAYLYDVDPSGVGTLMTYAIATAPSGELSTSLRPLSWTIPAGDHLALVVDTVDPRFAAAETGSPQLTLSSPASLSMPVRR